MKHRRRRRLHKGRQWFLISLLAAGLTGLHAPSAAGEALAPPEPVVLRADGAGVVLEWRAPDFWLRPVTGDDGRPYIAVETSGWAQTADPGQPQLPTSWALAVVPPTSDVILHVETLDQAHHPLTHPIVPAYELVPIGDPPTDAESVWARDEGAYTGAGPRPADVVTLEEAGWLRGRRLVRLTYHPLRFDPAEGALEVARRVQVELRFATGPTDANRGQAAGESAWSHDDLFTPVLQNSVVNPAQVTRFARAERSTSAPHTSQDPTPDGNPRYKLIISREGVYELTYDALAAAGVPLGTTPRTAYRLTHAGQEVAYQWQGDGDGAFEPGERILFYARPTLTRFADYDVYWLTVGATSTQASVRTGDPSDLPPATAWTTAVAEHGGGGQHYLSSYPSGRDGDRWYWERLYWDTTTGTGAREKDLSITLATPDRDASNATLRVYLQGTTRDDAVDPDHRVAVYLNGSLLRTAEWDGATYHVATFAAPPSLLRTGNNTVRLRLPGNGALSGVEEAWLDALELRYGIGSVCGNPIRVAGEVGQNRYTVGCDDVRIYDVTYLTATRVVTPFHTGGGSVSFGDADAGTATYFLLSEDQIVAPDEIVPALTLTDPPDGADYLIIAHSDFIDAVAPLANHRATVDGMRVFSATVEAIYDAYGNGQADPEAIKDYIKDAYNNWVPPTLSYVLLVGDGTEDAVNRAQSTDANPNYVPPYMIELWDYEAASDNRYVTVDGDDNLADLFIGRLPVNSSAETTTVVEKILSYELSPPQWPWNERVLFFAGNESGGYFHQYSDDVYHDHLPSSFAGRRVYFCTSGCDQPHEYDGIDAAHDAAMRELNTGGLLASYWGHSSIHQWAVDPETYAPMFHLDDVADLHNSGALPVLLEMTCYTSHFSEPSGDTLDESLVRRAGGGAAATWGSSTLASTGGHRILHPEFFDAVFEDGTTRLGPATEAAKTYLPPYLSYIRDIYVLLGDPAMDLNLDIVPWTHGAFLPLALRGN
jgi:hypothetical protein